MRIRLTRPLTSFEVEVLAAAEPGVRTEGDAIVVPDARLDDIARAHDAWSERLERVESLAEELEGAAWLADQRRVAEQSRHGSHLGNAHVSDRGMH